MISAAWIQYTNVTDGHLATAETALTHSVACYTSWKRGYRHGIPIGGYVWKPRDTARWKKK